MKYCIIPLYGTEKTSEDLLDSVNRYLITSDVNVGLEEFDKEFTQITPENKERHVITEADTDEDAAKAVKFIKDLKEICDRRKLSKPKFTAKLETLFNHAKSVLSVELDQTKDIIIPVSEDLDKTQTKWDAQDYNTRNLESHFDQMYGNGAYGVKNYIKEKFRDGMTAVAYWNQNASELVAKNNTILNKRIADYKNNLYSQIVEFLQNKYPENETIKNLKPYMFDSEGKLNSQYFATLRLFYNVTQNTSSFKSDVDSDWSKSISSNTQDKIKSYMSVVSTLLAKSDIFKEKASNRYTVQKFFDMQQQLYDGELFSEYYNWIKKAINNPDTGFGDIQIDETTTVKEEFDKIEKNDDISFLDAASAYTQLTHFDELLSDQCGDSFEVQNKGVIQANDNYSYHKETAHEKKAWQQSESVASEKYTSSLTNAILNQIYVYDYKTDLFKNRRVNSTSLIVASRNLINDILYNKLNFSGISGNASQGYAEFIDCVIKLHDDPETNFAKILEFLFSNTSASNKGLAYQISKKELLTDYDLDLLKSVYNTIYDTKNSRSLRSLVLKNQLNSKMTIPDILGEISGYVDRNTTMDYLEINYNAEKGLFETKIKRKFFNGTDVYKTRVRMNHHINTLPFKVRQDLQTKYNLSISEDTSGGVHYSIGIKGETITLGASNASNIKILGNTGVDFETKDIFAKIDKVNLTNFRQKLVNGFSDLTEEEQKLYDMLEFIDDMLGFKFISNPNENIQILETLKSTYAPTATGTIQGNFYLMPLMSLAIRAAYINNQYVQANDKSLKTYLENSNDSFHDTYKANPKSKLFSDDFGEVQYRLVGYNDEIINLWADAKSMVNGDGSKATTKDGQGNSIPNNSVNKLGSMLRYYIDKQKGTNVDTLLFVEHPGMIKGTVYDLEVTTQWQDKKSVKAFSTSELIYHSVFNKFWGSYLQNKQIVVQPTTYSDKTTFINYALSTVINDVDLMTTDDYATQVISLYKSSIGDAYRRIWKSSLAKLQQITGKTTVKEINEELHKLSESELINKAKNLGLTLELDKDYRTKKGKSCAINELLQYYAEELYQKNDEGEDDVLAKLLNEQKKIFIQNIVDSNSSFQVIDYNLSYDTFIEEKNSVNVDSNNPVLNTILELFKNNKAGRIKFFKDWVDQRTGRLILAKQNGKNIMTSKVDTNADIIVNPLLDRFFYIEGLMSNNLRMSLTGSEINHPDKAKSTVFDQAKNLTWDQFNLRYGKLIDGGLTEGEYNEISQSLNDCYSISDLQYSDAYNSARLQPIVKAIRNETLLQIANVAQGTQFKRNVIIPATLQYCQQNLKDGIAPRIKCAVIRDESADVFNYRGDVDKIDSADGAAKINPFQSILENKALGSQAVGFTKKPIWHGYNAENGTAFLAKFATNTITNEEMRASINSNTSMFNLFKKMTNLSWKGHGKNVDLLQTITEGNIAPENVTDVYGKEDIAQRWFKSVILGNSTTVDSDGNEILLNSNRLIYSDSYGNKTEIVGFNRTNSKSGPSIYYTMETPYIEVSQGKVPLKKVFHLFYDEVEPNGIVRSKHKTFEGKPNHPGEALKAAQEFLANPPANVTNVHNIDSLFELHTALGGINCVDESGKSSEFSNEVVVNFMNNVGSPKPGTNPKKDLVNQKTYDQPLKDMHIGYALNNSSVKNGAQNINDSSRWSNNEDLDYFEVDSDGLGMQMNADHDIVDSELTEFSQVITATAAYGYTANNTSEIFYGLAQAAMSSSENLLNAVNSFLNVNFGDADEEAKAKVKSDLYETVGRILFVNSSIKDKESLQSIIYQGVQSVFFKNKNHTNDDIKIPFSDPTVYSEFISTLASTINKDSIKRKHPGSGCVIVPGYNIMQYFELKVPGQRTRRMNTANVLKSAVADYKQELLSLLQSHPNYDPDDESIEIEGEDEPIYISETDTIPQLLDAIKTLQMEYSGTYAQIPEENQEQKTYFINSFLNKLQSQEAKYSDFGYFVPSDIVNVYVNGQLIEEGIDLNTLETYYTVGDKSRTLKQISALSEGLITFDSDNDVFKINLLNTEDPEEQLKRFVITLASIEAGDKVELNEQETALVAEHPEIFNGLLQPVSGNIYIKQENKFEYQSCITKPRNLKPSLIRWQYRDDNGTAHWTNIFEQDVIKNAYLNKENRDAKYRDNIQELLNNLANGKSPIGTMIEGSLENTAAELIMSNLYRDKFATGTDSLDEILEEGEEYFIKKHKNLRPPFNNHYDVAFLKDSGKGITISFSEPEASSADSFINPNDFSEQELQTDSEGNVYYVKGSRRLFKVAKWIPASDIHWDGTNFLNKSGAIVDKKQYRLTDDGTIEKYLQLVKRYDSTVKGKSNKYYKNDLYYLTGESELAEYFKLHPKAGESNLISASKYLSSILNKIYHTDQFKCAVINPNIADLRKSNLNKISKYMSFWMGDDYITDDVKTLFREQLNSIEPFETKELSELKQSDPEAYKARTKEIRNASKAAFKKAQDEFNRNHAHKQWISFLDSQQYIAARIPAQSLQSFMTMETIGWTENSTNMAYVSHFQTYLQGSDYDIDKAYIMGQSYDQNGEYIGWSNLFDYTSHATLQASKALPAPKYTLDKQTGKKIYQTLVYDEDGINISADLQELSKYIQNVKGKGVYVPTITEQGRLRVLKLFKDILSQIGSETKVNYAKDQEYLINMLNGHYHYIIPNDIMESAFKNVASANIYAVSHDIRNRDQAYTAITMDDIRKSADNSPKGNQAATLNMFNPLTKYIMQYQNIVGKNVISIAANGEKVWFNAFYYWNQVLKSGDPERIKRLKFRHTFNRIAGRSIGTPFENTSYNHLPDMNKYDSDIRDVLMNEFGLSKDDMAYKYVDQQISQLLSAATDNAKELILAKINAGSNFAKMYVSGIMLGIDMNDLVAFMTSPIGEYVDSISGINVFSENLRNNYPEAAISAALGKFSAGNFLHGSISIAKYNAETEQVERGSKNKISYLLSEINGNENVLALQKLADQEEEFEHLNDAIEFIIQKSLELNSDFDFSELYSGSDVELNNYLDFCQQKYNGLKQVISEYMNKDKKLTWTEAYQNYFDDITEFRKLFKLSNEISSIASAYLGLNQGIPTAEVDILQRLNRMEKIVTERENFLGVTSDIFIKETDSDERKAQKQKLFDEAVKNIHENNPYLDEAEIIATLKEMQDLVGNFSASEYILNDDYKQRCIKYYDILKGTLNVFDLMDNLPQYGAILDCFKAVLLADKTLSSKSRLVSKIIKTAKLNNVSDKQLKGIIKYIDQKNVINFTKTLDPINADIAINDAVVNNGTDGFSIYFAKQENMTKIDFKSQAGLATFRYFMENTLYPKLKEIITTETLVDESGVRVKNPLYQNSFLSHLEKVPDGKQMIIATTIDLLRPTATSASKEIYNEILRGMAVLEGVHFSKDLTWADVFQLYNLIVNKNQFGDERLTTVFKVCKDDKSILKRFWKSLSDLDYSGEEIDVNKEDYLIASAPVIAQAQERYHHEKYVKVLDSNQGIILKKLNDNNEYEEINLLPQVSVSENFEDKVQRLKNFSEYSSFDLINDLKSEIIRPLLEFESIDQVENPDKMISELADLLKNYSIASKILFYKDC